MRVYRNGDGEMVTIVVLTVVECTFAIPARASFCSLHKLHDEDRVLRYYNKETLCPYVNL